MRSLPWLLLLIPLVAAAAGGRSYHNDALKLRAFEPPAGWTMQPLAAGRPVLRAATISVERPAGEEQERARLEATIDSGRRVSRQLYAVTEGFGYVMAMVGAAARTLALKRDFDDAAQSLVVGDSGEPAAPRK